MAQKANTPISFIGNSLLVVFVNSRWQIKEKKKKEKQRHTNAQLSGISAPLLGFQLRENMYLKNISWAGTYHILFGFMSIIGFAFGLLCNMGLTHQSSCPELYNEIWSIYIQMKLDFVLEI